MKFFTLYNYVINPQSSGPPYVFTIHTVAQKYTNTFFEIRFRGFEICF